MTTKAIEEARAFEQTRDLVNQALKSKWNPVQSNEGPYGPYVIQTFPTSVVYEWTGKTYESDYSIEVVDGKSQVTLSDPVEVAVTYAPMTEAAATQFSTDFVALSEKALKKNGEAQIKIIQPGWGSSGYYPPEMLERDGPTVFKAGTKMYWDHPTPTEEAERPERSLRDLAAELTTDAQWLPNASEGAGLYAYAKVFDTFAPAVEQMAPHIGVSIRATGKAKAGVAEGKKGPIIEKLVAARSVDFVTEPGAGGQVVQLFESARGGQRQQEDTDMDEAQVKAMIEAATKPLQESLATTATTLKETQTENARLREALTLRESRDFIASELAKSPLPNITRVRLAESLANEAPMKEGALDKEALKTVVEAAIKEETDYLANVTGSPIRGMNSMSESETNPEKVGEKLTSAFSKLGLSESAAKVAAAGRN